MDKLMHRARRRQRKLYEDKGANEAITNFHEGEENAVGVSKVL